MKREASDVSCREIDIQGHPPGSPDRLDSSYSEFLHNARGKSWAFVRGCTVEIGRGISHLLHGHTSDICVPIREYYLRVSETVSQPMSHYSIAVLWESAESETFSINAVVAKY
jgi:hypothetical protein